MLRSLFLCTIICLFMVGCTKNNSKAVSTVNKDLKPNSRELKILLDADFFKNRDDGFRDLWSIVKEVADEQGVETEPSDKKFKQKRRQVLFLDTKDFAIRKTGYVLRKRVKYKKKNKKLAKKMEYTLKFRSEDMVKSAKADISSTDYGAKSEFEEDMGYSAESVDKFKRKFSKRNKIKTRDNPGSTIKDFAEIFPVLKELGIPEQTVLEPVNGITIDEWRVSPGILDFGSGLIAKADITLWYDRSGKPLIAEFSFDHKISDFDNQNEQATQKMFDFFLALRERLADRVAKETTKTGFTYGRVK